jgi:hypothetical protein
MRRCGRATRPALCGATSEVPTDVVAPQVPVAERTVFRSTLTDARTAPRASRHERLDLVVLGDDLAEALHLVGTAAVLRTASNALFNLADTGVKRRLVAIELGQKLGCLRLGLGRHAGAFLGFGERLLGDFLELVGRGRELRGEGLEVHSVVVGHSRVSFSG